jgi:hypothetical protein
MADKYQKSIYNLVHLKKAKIGFDGIYIDNEKLSQDIDVLWELYNNYQKLLNEKIPQKPVKGKIIYNSYENIQTYHCSCGRELSFADNYCGKCGTEIDWEEVKNNG